jgi:hypothetical protein
MGSVTIGMPTEIPASKSKSVGVPADWTVAMTVTPPAVTVTGSAMSDPAGGADERTQDERRGKGGRHAYTSTSTSDPCTRRRAESNPNSTRAAAGRK